MPGQDRFGLRDSQRRQVRRSAMDQWYRGCLERSSGSGLSAAFRRAVVRSHTPPQLRNRVGCRVIHAACRTLFQLSTGRYFRRRSARRGGFGRGRVTGSVGNSLLNGLHNGPQHGHHEKASQQDHHQFDKTHHKNNKGGNPQTRRRPPCLSLKLTTSSWPAASSSSHPGSRSW